MSGTINIEYRGKHYQAQYESSASSVAVDVSWDGCHKKTRMLLGHENPASIAHFAALKMLREATERGELIDERTD